ncbi:MAG: hypothetical protein GY927_00835 [bacterium]|nr:hypothetical protein [bacterium]
MANKTGEREKPKSENATPKTYDEKINALATLLKGDLGAGDDYKKSIENYAEGFTRSGRHTPAQVKQDIDRTFTSRFGRPEAAKGVTKAMEKNEAAKAKAEQLKGDIQKTGAKGREQDLER